MPFLIRVDRRIWWLTVSKAADRSSNIRNEDLEAILASLRSSTTESKAVSVECPLLKPDWLLSRKLFCVKKAVTWLNTTRSSVFPMKGRRETSPFPPSGNEGYIRNRDVPYQSVTLDVTSEDRRIGIPTKRPRILPLPVSRGGLLCRYFLAQVRAPIGRSVTVAMALPTQ